MKCKLLTISSRQIRPPIYSLKQSKLRKRRVTRFAIIYFALLLLFIILLVAPIVGGKYLNGVAKGLPLNLAQPIGLNHNDTYIGQTGTKAPSGFSITNAAFTPSASAQLKMRALTYNLKGFHA